jgi:DNA invertase Pin-like site-specific DNA recombinase
MAGKKKTTRKKPGRVLGYARVSTLEQDLTLQTDALKQQGCTQRDIFIDNASGARAKRPGLEACLAALQAGDVLLVWRLDRLGRSMPHLVTLIEQFKERGIGFRSICDGAIDTTTASGELIFDIFSALAQFEQRLIQERTRAGLSAARARGRRGGRKPLPPTHPKVLTAKKMYQDRAVEVRDICTTLNISRATLYRYVAMVDS